MAKYKVYIYTKNQSCDWFITADNKEIARQIAEANESYGYKTRIVRIVKKGGLSKNGRNKFADAVDEVIGLDSKNFKQLNVIYQQMMDILTKKVARKTVSKKKSQKVSVDG